MTIIVCNLQAHAVTHYALEFQSLSGSYAAGKQGLVKLGGNDDAGEPIDSHVRTPVTPHGSTFKKALSSAYVTCHKAGVQQLDLVVHTPAGKDYVYPVGGQMDGVAKVLLGRGISENLLGFGVHNIAGADFEIAQIEVLVAASKNRRI